MKKAAIYGASGYTGLELIRILLNHSNVELTAVTSRRFDGLTVAEVFPALSGLTSLKYQNATPQKIASVCDVIFLALPHGVSMDIAPHFVGAGKKVIDLSADYRLRDVKEYESWYVPHKSSSLLSEAVYGLPELYRKQIKKSILAMAPLLKESLVEPGTIIADSKSGVSGAGRGVSLGVHFCEVHEGFKAYKVAEHRHRPEMEQELSGIAGIPVGITFTPHLVPMSRGILSTVYASLKNGVDLSRVEQAFHSFYHGAPFVRLCGSKDLPTTLQVRGSNYCDLGWRVDEPMGRIIVVSVIDNLTRGASGQAVCNMNLMFCFPENLGLDSPPWQP